ncbi:MAG: LAGLIDADG family homing endonuclease [Nanoarchaeota archaeon]
MINKLNMPYGHNKSLKIVIPDAIKDNWNFAKYFIRGLFDTDGSVFAVKKPRIEKYPSIELTTISKTLAEQVKFLLEQNGFRVSKIWEFKQKSRNLGYRFGLNGQDNLKKWIKEIGFSNPYKLERAKSYL